MLIHELLNKDPYTVPEESHINILDNKSDVCIARNSKDTKYNRRIAIIVQYVRNSEKCKMHNIDWREGGLQLVDIVTNNVGENDLNPRMKYITEIIDNWDKKLVQEGWQDIG